MRFVRGLPRTITVTATLLVAVVGLPAAAFADSDMTGRDFGRHVVTCEQTTGFSGQHNPGMHQGFAGWDPTHTC